MRASLLRARLLREERTDPLVLALYTQSSSRVYVYPESSNSPSFGPRWTHTRFLCLATLARPLSVSRSRLDPLLDQINTRSSAAAAATPRPRRVRGCDTRYHSQGCRLFTTRGCSATSSRRRRTRCRRQSRPSPKPPRAHSADYPDPIIGSGSIRIRQRRRARRSVRGALPTAQTPVISW